MSISQAGVYSLKLYENKDFSFLYDSLGNIVLSSISNTGDTLELETNDNFIKYTNALVPAENNTTLNDHTLAFEINGLDQSNLDIIEKLQSSIYGWIALITFMDNQVYLINIPFHPKYDKFDSQVTHTFFVELKPRIFTLEKLEGVVEAQGVNGLLDFDGNDDYVIYPQEIANIDNGLIYIFNTLIKNGFNPGGTIIHSKGFATYQIYIYWRPGFDSRLVVDAGGGYGAAYDLAAYKGSQIEIDVSITNAISPISPIDYFKVNGIGLIESANYGGVAIAGSTRIGDNLGGGNYLSNTLVWGINIYDGITHQNNIQGQPEGNTNAAWDDTIGILTATVNGSPTTINLP